MGFCVKGGEEDWKNLGEGKSMTQNILYNGLFSIENKNIVKQMYIDSWKENKFKHKNK